MSADVTALALALGTRTLVQARARARIAVVGDSIAAGGYQGSGFAERAARRGGLRVAGNLAASGATSEQVLAQVPAALATRAPLVLCNGGANDVSQSVTAATTRANVRALWAALRAGGADPVDVGPLPRGDNATNAVKHADHALWRMQAAERARVLHVAPWPLLAAPDGGWRGGLSFDPVHPGALAANLIADAVLDRLDRPARTASFLELVDRAAGPGTCVPNAVGFGGVGGALPAGYFAVGSGGAYSVVAADAGDFGNWLRCTISGATGSQVGFSGTARTLGDLGVATGDRMALGVKLRWSAGSAGGLRPRIAINAAAGLFALYDEYGAPTESLTIYHEFTVPAGAATLSLSVTATASEAGYFEISRPLLYNLTGNGLL